MFFFASYETKRNKSHFGTKSTGTKIFSQDALSISCFLYNIKTRRHYKLYSLSCLTSNNYLTDKSTYVCTFCLNHAEKLQKETSLEIGT